MKNTLIILFSLMLFSITAYYQDKLPFWERLKNTLQEPKVSSGVLDYGSMGKVLKKTGLIKTVPREEGYLPVTNQALIRIYIDTNIESNLQVYWAKEKQHYSQERSTGIPVTPGKNKYELVIPALKEIHRLRIDPISELADVRISRVAFEQGGERVRVLSSDDGLEFIKPLSGIDDYIVDPEGISFTTTTADPQFELILDSLKKIEDQAFQRKRQQTHFQHIGNPGRIEDLPSSRVIKENHFKKNWPIVSIVVDEDDLYHPDTGIIPNKRSRGAYWERPAYFSYYDESGELAFGSMVGVRIHGGKRIQLFNSFRLYFRKEYGISHFPEFRPKIKFSSRAEPLKRLIVHHTAWPPGGWVFNNPLAYDISSRMGCVVPETKLSLLFVNGVEMGIHFLVPQINDKLLKDYFGHKDFIAYKFRSENSRESEAFYNTKLWKPTTSHEKLTMEEVGKTIDLDNLARHLFSFVFCGTTDFYQGIGVLEKGRPGSKLFWINWDMDHSFYDVSRRYSGREIWKQKGWPRVYKQSHYHSGRTQLFSRLLNEDPAYREFVISLCMDLLNHRVTQGYLQSRLEYYNDMLVSYGQNDSEYIENLELFFRKRPAFIRDEMRDMFKLGPSFSCRVKGPAGIQYEIDSYPETIGYNGYYFEGKNMTVSISSSHKDTFSHWLVNGRKVEGSTLSFTVLADSTIEPVFRNDD